MSNQYIYVGKQIHPTVDLEGCGITEKKIGLTTDNPVNRAKSISGTKTTVKYTQIAAWIVDDCNKVEKMLHSILRHDRIQGTEFFNDDQGTLVDRIGKFMEYYGAKSYTLGKFVPSPPRGLSKDDSWDNFFNESFVKEFREKLQGQDYRIFPTKTRAYLKIQKGSQKDTRNTIVLLPSKNIELDSWVKNGDDDKTRLFEAAGFKQHPTQTDPNKVCWRRNLKDMGVDNAITLINNYYELTNYLN